MIKKDMKPNKPKKKSLPLINFSYKDARKFFLKGESYCNVDLPSYFDFSSILNGVYKEMSRKNLKELSNNPNTFEKVNHIILGNKDGKYSWRPLQLIHPALYVSLVNHITEENNWKLIKNRFHHFSKAKNISCLSIPVQSLGIEKDKAAQITKWWHQFEQKSIELALDYEYITHTDITDCYGSIYTHSISWALHEKNEAKNNKRKKDMIGNIIDNHIQGMSNGQTNGIPQGSILMDFIAEMVLGFADIEIARKIEDSNVTDFRILRYRDDYRIFTNNPQDSENILKCITESMIELGLKINSSKTSTSSSVIRSSIKPDKIDWIQRKQYDGSIQKHLLIIYEHAEKYPNSGSLVAALSELNKRIRSRKRINQITPLISIIVDIAYNNPRTYPICSAILGKFLDLIGNINEKKRILEKIMKKFRKIPNTGYMEVWLQRVSLEYSKDLEFSEPLCRLVRGEDVSLWNNDWISSKNLKNFIDSASIIDKEKMSAATPVIPLEEIDLFTSKSEY